VQAWKGEAVWGAKTSQKKRTAKKEGQLGKALPRKNRICLSKGVFYGTTIGAAFSKRLHNLQKNRQRKGFLSNFLQRGPPLKRGGPPVKSTRKMRDFGKANFRSKSFEGGTALSRGQAQLQKQRSGYTFMVFQKKWDPCSKEDLTTSYI